MDSETTGLDFAAIGHQDSWHTITSFVNDIRAEGPAKLSQEQIKNIFPYLPPRDLFRVQVKSTTGAEIKGVYIETFIDPSKLDAQSLRTNISKVRKAVAHATKMGARIVAMGGFTSILLEGNLDSYTKTETKFTTGNTLTTAFIVKGVEQTASQLNIDLKRSSVLCIGATGDIGLACVEYLKHKVKKLLLCARNHQRLQDLAMSLSKENIPVAYSTALDDLVADADIIISMASSAGIKLDHCKKGILICDAGYPKNLDSKVEDDFELKLFHGGMGQVNQGYQFNPDYSSSMYQYSSPNIIHGCLLEAMVMAFENRYENYSAGKGKITTAKVEEIYRLGLKHGIGVAPLYNTKGLWTPS
jgi:fatty aldehyde-generating acyl-ACP reductase